MKSRSGIQAPVIEFLASPSAYGRGSEPVEIRETHISLIFLVGNNAFKMKKAVDLGYLDFSTLEKRRIACDAELNLNRRTAPCLYLDLVRVTYEADGRLALDGDGKVIEWLVKMRRFDETRLAVNLAHRNELDLGMLEALAKNIAAFHGAAERRPAFGGAEAMGAIIQSNHSHLKAFENKALAITKVQALFERSREAVTTHAGLLGARRAEGFVRRCHGDLHLGNIIIEESGPLLFDCIEFSDRMACIDTFYDLAFLLMDLWHLQLREGANRVLNSYLIALPVTEREAALNGLSLVPFFLSCRAGVRAHVTAQVAEAHGGKQTDFALAQDYLEESLGFLDPMPPVLLAVGGLSGSGKTSVSRALAPELGRPPGAVVLRSDELRKRLLGKDPDEPLGPDAYTEKINLAVYERMARDACTALSAGQAVIADAVHARPEERAAIKAIAQIAGVPFKGLWLDVPAHVMEHRLEARRNDASDATVKVLEQQLGYDLGAIGWARIDGSRGLEGTLQIAKAML
ncbi:AAA family ATPase [bacterium AH-315-P15]|nr:AAA family ATPase [bacterium AH-315-P15]